MRIPLSKPSIGDAEVAYVTRVLRSGQLSFGAMLEEFESRFADYVGTRYAVATNSGTSALHLAVKALGIGPGDEVLTTSFSFAASTNCLLYERAVPVFVDIDPDTLNIDPIEIRRILERDYCWDPGREHAVNRNTGNILKAILPVHLFGLPCAMDALLEIARDYNLRVLEDACEALGAECGGRRVGNFGDAAVFAFYPNKQITTGEGGMLVTNDQSIAVLCRSLRNQGRDENSAWLRHARLGYNYRLSDLHCALGVAQMERVDELLSVRRCLAAMYSLALDGVSEILPMRDPEDALRSWFVYVIRLREPYARRRDEVMGRLRARGIECQAYFPAIHEQPYFRELCGATIQDLPHTQAACRQCLALPFFPGMTSGQVEEVSFALRQTLAECETAPDFGAVKRRGSVSAIA
ncbi:MAG TPA: DegT/DnrJ/EryC1/StrS family aminotransferase [Candidatus Acidoferrales bacterium]